MFGHDDHHDNDNGEHKDEIKPAVTSSDNNWQHPGPPPADDDKDSSDSSDKDVGPSMSYEDNDQPASFSLGQSHDDQPDTSAHGDNDLIDLKQEALTKLSPLVGHLDQSPDEKFRTLMMMIQASDNQSMVREAYETALKIDDEKERARALLDIVNEINYFTHNPKQQ